MNKPKESDWKKFRDSLEKWRERYLKDKNDEIRSILNDSERDETEKFWSIVDFQKREAKILRDCLDGNSRSKMFLHIALMKRYGMIGEEDLKVFSQELRDSLNVFNN